MKDTYGTIVYQEQIMQIFQTLAGYTLGGADMVRRMMGKKKLDEMAKQKGIFIEGAGKNGMSEKDASALFEQIESFAKYCFNRSHSAAYAFVAYQTAYLKAHYPVEYMCSILTSQADNQDKTQQYILQCQALGIDVLPPDINKSASQFFPDGDNIRFGLASIKNVGGAVIEEIEKERQNGEFESFYDFCSRVDSKCLNKKTLESLIKAGAFAGVEKSRKQLLDNIDNVVNYVQKTKKTESTGQVSLFAALADEAQDLNLPTFELTGSSDDEFSDSEIQQFEHELMGIYVTSHPLSSIRGTLKYITTDTVSDILENPENDKGVTICGLLSQVVQKPTRKDPAKFLKTGIIEDLTGRVEIVAFPKTVEQFGHLINSEERVIIKGKIQNREEQINLVVQDVKLIGHINLVTIKYNKDLAFEENIYLKELLAKYKGDDPVIIDFADDDSERVQMLTNANLWVKNDPQLEDDIKKAFKDKLDYLVTSLN